MNKQDQIQKAKDVIKDRQVAITKYCYCADCKNCPASWENNEDHLSCFTSERYKIEWLQNWLKENETSETNGVVISRELLDELIRYIQKTETYMPMDRFDEELCDKLLKLRGKK